MTRIAALVVSLGSLGGLGACHHEPAPVHDPADLPPLPPASGTPIGYLVDGASDLHLRDDQVARLREIDDTLAAELASLDSQSRPAAGEPAPGDASSGGGAPRGGGRRGRGGFGRGGMGGMGGRGRGGRGNRQAPPNASGPSGQPGSARLTEERAADVRVAIQRAFEVLDPDQREPAEHILADHGVDPDAGRGAGSATPAPESSEPPAP